jgi:acetoin utilization deacetylase AcuC-like enzyme
VSPGAYTFTIASITCGKERGLKVFYADEFVLPLPPGHRFPIEKYWLLRKRVSEAGPGLSGSPLLSPAATDDEIMRVHTLDYWHRFREGRLTAKEMRRIGFPWSPELVERSRRSTGGTIAACRAALCEGVAVNLAGGTHHAFPDHGEGFCVINDVAVAVRAIQAEGLANRSVVIDCDVHQGNGTAAIMNADPSVFTFSIHGAKNFPFRKEPGDLDIELDDGADDATYLAALREGLDVALHGDHPDLVVYLAGADPYQGDRLGRLSLTKAGLARRDETVLAACLAIGTPVAVVMGGGYSDPIVHTVDIHFRTVQLAAEAQQRWQVQRGQNRSERL